MTERDARECLYEYGDGRPLDEPRQVSMTRYFGERSNPFVRGMELKKNDPDIREKEWIRYTAYPLNEFHKGNPGDPRQDILRYTPEHA